MMVHNSVRLSDEAQPLNARPSPVPAQDMDLHNHSNEHHMSPVSPPALSTHHGMDSGALGEAAPPYTPLDSEQRRHLNSRYHGDGLYSKTDHRVHRLWLWELLSIAAAALALVATVITLALHKERPLPKWPSAITINALIAVFTAIFKACLMMPISECIGQLKWLWYQRPRPLGHMEQWDLASRGRLLRCPFPHNLFNNLLNWSYLGLKPTHFLMFRSMGFSAPNL